MTKYNKPSKTNISILYRNLQNGTFYDWTFPNLEEDNLYKYMVKTLRNNRDIRIGQNLVYHYFFFNKDCKEYEKWESINENTIKSFNKKYEKRLEKQLQIYEFLKGKSRGSHVKRLTRTNCTYLDLHNTKECNAQMIYNLLYNNKDEWMAISASSYRMNKEDKKKMLDKIAEVNRVFTEVNRVFKTTDTLFD